MKRFLTAAGLTAALALTGCASAPGENYVPPTAEEREAAVSDQFITFEKTLRDGRLVECITNEVAISCDWSNAR